MATTADTSDRDNSHGRTTEVEQQLNRLVDDFETIDWRDAVQASKPISLPVSWILNQLVEARVYLSNVPMFNEPT